MTAFELFPLRAFADSYIWKLRGGRRAAVVDPGGAQPVLGWLRSEPLEPAVILNTHHHADHVGDNSGLLQHLRVPVFGSNDERIREVTDRPARKRRPIPLCVGGSRPWSQAPAPVAR